MDREYERDVNISNILMKKYEILRSEILFWYEAVKRQYKFLQIFMAGSLTVVSYIVLNYSEKQFVTGLATFGVSGEFVLIFIIFSIITVSYYFCFDVLDSFSSMFVVAARLDTIEEELNKLYNKTILVWESKIQTRTVERFSPPKVLFAVFQFVLILVYSTAVPLYLCYKLWEKSVISSTIFSMFGLYTVGCFALLVYAYLYTLNPGRRAKVAQKIREFIKEPPVAS
jgi:hypothetical protein